MCAHTRVQFRRRCIVLVPLSSVPLVMVMTDLFSSFHTFRCLFFHPFIRESIPNPLEVTVVRRPVYMIIFHNTCIHCG